MEPFRRCSTDSRRREVDKRVGLMVKYTGMIKIVISSALDYL